MTKKVTAVDILARAAELLKDPESWTQGAFSRVKLRHARPEYRAPSVPWNEADPSDCAFCLEGARRMACRQLGVGIHDDHGEKGPGQRSMECLIAATTARVDQLDLAPVDSEQEIIWLYNDTHGRAHTEILSVLADAKDRCTEDPK